MLGQDLRMQGERVNGEVLLKAVEAAFNEPGVLPEEPNTVEVEAWLHKVRRAYL